MKVKSESEVAQSCLTLSGPIDESPPGSSVHGISQARVLEWGASGYQIGQQRYIERKKTTGWSTEEPSVEKTQPVEESYPTTDLFSVSTSFFFFQIPHISETIRRVSFIQHSSPKVLLLPQGKNFILFMAKEYSILYIYQLLYPFIHGRTLRLFQWLIGNNSAMNIVKHISFQISVFIFLR